MQRAGSLGRCERSSSPSCTIVRLGFTITTASSRSMQASAARLLPGGKAFRQSFSSSRLVWHGHVKGAAETTAYTETTTHSSWAALSTCVVQESVKRQGDVMQVRLSVAFPVCSYTERTSHVGLAQEKPNATRHCAST